LVEVVISVGVILTMDINDAGQSREMPAHNESERYKLKYELLETNLEELRRKTQGDPQLCWECQANMLQHLLEAEILIGHSVDQMRDCLLKYEEDGHAVYLDVIE
jgi:hypothetical protein